MKPSSRPPRAPSGFLVFSILLVWSALLSGVSHAAPCITISKKSGPPTSQILVSGRGFESNVGVDIYFDTKDEALVVTNGKGEFKDAKAYAPRSARPGQHWVTALERNNDKGAQKPFLVQTDWAQFHFTADGTRLNPYENVLNPKNVVNLDVKWSYDTGNVVYYSSPAVVNGVVYVGSYYLYALNAHTGAKLWNYDASTSTASPAVANGVVYTNSTDGSLYALDARTGVKLWTSNIGSDDYSSPAVADGVVYVGSGYPDNSLYALNAHTGAKLWSYTTGKPVDSSPVVADGVVYFASQDYNLYALDASTGSKLWSYNLGSVVLVATAPVVANGVVYIGSWTGILYALNAENGTELWSFDPCKNCIFASPAIANGVVYIGSEGGDVYALDGQTGAVLWRYQTGSFALSSPAVANGVLYVGSGDNKVYALDARTGAELWSYPTGYWVVSSPSVVNGVVYIGSWDNNVYAFSLRYGSRDAGSATRPDLTTLRPDLSLKVSVPLAAVLRPD